FFFSSRRRHTRFSRDWSSDVCSSDLYSRPYNTGRHTIAEHLWNLDDYVRDALSARGYAEVKFTDWLTFTTNISMDVTSTDGREYQNPRVGDGYPAGRFSRYSSKVTSYKIGRAHV